MLERLFELCKAVKSGDKQADIDAKIVVRSYMCSVVNALAKYDGVELSKDKFDEKVDIAFGICTNGK